MLNLSINKLNLSLLLSGPSNAAPGFNQEASSQGAFSDLELYLPVERGIILGWQDLNPELQATLTSLAILIQGFDMCPAHKQCIVDALQNLHSFAEDITQYTTWESIEDNYRAINLHKQSLKGALQYS